MVMLNEGLNRVRDLFTADLISVTLGTGTATVSATGTGLEHPVNDSTGTVSTEKRDRQVTASYTLPSTTSIGTVFSEIAVNMNGTQLVSSGTSVQANRQVYFPLTHNENEEFVFETTFFVTQD